VLPKGLILIRQTRTIAVVVVVVVVVVILPVVLYGCETWSLTRREERKPRVFEYMVLRGIFGPRLEQCPGCSPDTAPA